MIEEIEIKSINHYFEVIDTLGDTPRDYIYRGQSNKDWPLKPSIYRRFHRYQAVIQEAFLIYTLQINEVNIKGLTRKIPVQFLANCQHYGVPTRLLDWSYSHLTTLFFACQEVSDNKNNELKKDGALFICNKTKLERFQNSDFRTITSTPKLVEINFNTPRIHSQQGCFLIWGQTGLQSDIDGTYSFEEYLNNSQKNQILRKVIIPYDIKADILKELKENYQVSQKSLYVENIHSEELINQYKSFRKASAVICHEITKLENEKSILFKNSFGLNLSGCSNLQSLPPDPGPFKDMLLKLINNKSNLTGRNDPCVCRSGKKYKKCCGYF